MPVPNFEPKTASDRKDVQTPPDSGKIGTGRLRMPTIGWWAFAGWFIALYVLSSIPGKHFGETPFTWADKSVHFVLFFSGAVPFTLALLGTLRLPVAVCGLLAWGAMVAVGVLDEYHQLFTPGRSGMDRGDICADAIGAAIGVACVCFFHARRRANTNRRAAGADRAA
jgi:Predicted integral membrane protein